MRRLLGTALLVAMWGLASMTRAAPPPDALERERAELSAAEAKHGADSVETLAALEALIAARRQSEDQSFAPDEVGSWIERALASSTRLRGPLAPGTIALRIDAAYRESDLQHHDPARVLADQARAEAEQSGDQELIARAAYAQGLLSHSARHFDQAEPLLREALAKVAALRGAKRDDAALVHFEARIEFLLGETMAQTGRFDEAKTRIGHTIALAQGLGAAGDKTRRRALATLAEIETRRGEYNAALQHFDQALALLPADAPPRARADFLSSYANALARSGDHERALALVRESLALEAGIEPPRLRERGMRRFLLATELMELEQHEAALAEFATAQRDLTEVFKPGHPLFAFLENNLGNLYLALDRNDEAQVHHRRALELFPENQVPERFFPRAGLGTSLLRQGRLVEASTEFRAALDGLQQAIGPSNYATSFVRTGLAATLWAQGKVDEAYAEAVEAERARQAIVGEIAPEFSERHAIALKDSLEPTDDWVLAIAAASRDPGKIREAWELAIQARGTVTQSVALRQAAARAAHDPRIATRWQQWLAANTAYAEALVAYSNEPKPDAETLGAPRAAYEAAERELGREVAAVAHARERARTRIAELETALPDGGALVVFATLKHAVPTHYDRRRLSERERRVFALVLEHGVAPRLVALGSQAEVDAAAGAFAQAMRDPAGSLERLREAGSTLRRVAWQPLGLDEAPRPVFVLADGALARVNFAALPARDDTYLVERGLAFHNLEHERDLLGTGTEGPKATRLVLVGAPDFERGARAARGDDSGLALRAQCAGLRGTTFTPLPYARLELEELAKIWRGSGAEPATVLAGAGANEEAVRGRLAGGGIVHFATHGVYLGDACAAPAVPGSRALSVVTSENAKDEAETSGLGALALSGANRGKAAARNDGLLTSEEIAALDLTGTDWAVLSACETGLGKSIRGEGVFGLRRAFRLAGARTVVMSLWSVQDQATRDWMGALYRARLDRHLSTIDSVAAAERETLAARRAAGQSTHPFYWAAFVAAGDWR